MKNYYRFLMLFVISISLASVVIAETPDSEGLLRLDLMSLTLKGNRSEAITKITNFLASNPHHPKEAEFLLRRGILEIDSGDLDNGRKDISSAMPRIDQEIEKNPNNDATIYLRGQARKATKDLDGALKDFQRAVELKPQSSEYKLGLMLAKQAH